MALTGTIIVSTDQLRTQAEVVRTEIGNMRTHFETLKGLIDGSASYWIGEGGDAHRKQYTGNLDWIEEMLKRYEEHVRDLEEMAGVYETAEQTAVFASDMLPASQLD